MITAQKFSSKFIIFSALLCIGSLTNARFSKELSIESKSACYAHPTLGSWRMLELEFVVKYSNELQRRTNQAQSVFLTASALFLGRDIIYHYCCDSAAPANATPDKKPDFNIQAHLAFAGIGKVAYDQYLDYVATSIKRQILVKFLKNWDQYRDLMPEEFTAAFDELSSTRPSALSNAQISEIFEIVLHLIEHNFEKRYKKNSPDKIDTIGMVKTISDITKNVLSK